MRIFALASAFAFIFASAETTVLQEYFSGKEKKYEKQVDEIFGELDIDENSVITTGELQQATWLQLKNDSRVNELIPMTAVTETQFNEANQVLSEGIFEFDTNRDGNITREEFHAGMAPIMNMSIPSKTELCDKTKLIVKQCREKPGVSKVSGITRAFFGSLCRSGISMTHGYSLESCVIKHADDCNKVAQCYNKDFRNAEMKDSSQLQKRDVYPADLKKKDLIFAILLFVGIFIPFIGPLFLVGVALAFFIDTMIRRSNSLKTG